MSKFTSKAFMAACLFILSIGSVQAAEISGVKVPEKITQGSKALQLNGAGVRDKFFIDLYVASLYLLNKEKDAKKIINSDELMALHIDVISSLITSEKMTNATLEGFDNSLNGDTAALQAKINDFLSTFKDEIKDGDKFELVYVPGIGVKVYKNAQLSKTIAGLDFKQALFGIWLSDKPAQRSLREEMLGK